MTFSRSIQNTTLSSGKRNVMYWILEGFPVESVTLSTRKPNTLKRSIGSMLHLPHNFG